MDNVLIIGCGDIGRRIARRLPDRRIVGLVRSEESAQRLRAAGIEPLQRDLDSADFALPELAPRTTLFHLAPPPPRGRSDPRTERLLAALAQCSCPPLCVVYLSTSGVYGDCGGAWVDETWPARPRADRAWRRWNAERQLLTWSATSGVPVVRLRVGGIYAPDRLPVARLRSGRLRVLCPEGAPWSNRIHAEDLARVCIAAAERGRSGALYNASDGHPTSMTDYFYRVADHLGLPRPPCVPADSAESELSPEMLSFLRESRRLDNRRMREELGVTPEFPDLDSGLRARVESE